MIRPCLTFVDRAEEAVKLYVSVFPNSKIVSMQRVESDGGPIPKGKLLNATFQLEAVSTSRSTAARPSRSRKESR